ncbi:MAG: hypothetical protein UCN61_04250, partial [Ruminococcus sp.]|nr:hypothetical protein [Ruminococcus sp.]
RFGSRLPTPYGRKATTKENSIKPEFSKTGGTPSLCSVSPPDCFLNARLRFPIRLAKNKKHPYGCLLFLERMMCYVHMLFVHIV